MPHRRTDLTNDSTSTLNPRQRTSMRHPCRLIPVWPACSWLSACLPVRLAADKSPNSACLECHSDKTLTKTNAAGKEVSLFVDEARLKATVHRTNTCTDCHADITSKHPDDNVPAQPPSCVKCHEKETKDYAASIHGVSHKLGASGAASCWDCHGSHDMLSPKESRVARLQTEPARDLRQMPQQPRADAGIPDEVSPGGGAVHGQHPRARLAQDGPHRRPLLQ